MAPHKVAADFSFLIANAPFIAPEVVGGTGNITPFPINTYADVEEMFNEYVADNPINIKGSPHKDFWNMGYIEFTTGIAPQTNIKIADCQTPSSANSNIIAILRGQKPPNASYNPGQMPLGGPYFPEAQINNLANWIDNGCPDVITFGETVGIFSTTDPVRLDIGTLAMKENVPDTHESWATELVLRRLDVTTTALQLFAKQTMRGTSSGPREPAFKRVTVGVSFDQAAFGAASDWKTVPSIQIRCSLTAIRRAKATIAILRPQRCASCAPQVLSQVDRPRFIITVAAWHGNPSIFYRGITQSGPIMLIDTWCVGGRLALAGCRSMPFQHVESKACARAALHLAWPGR